MLKFFNDYDKLHKNDVKEQKNTVTVQTPNGDVTEQKVPDMTADDMRKYFDAMKENLMSEIREELKTINNNPQVNAPIDVDNVASQNNNIEGGNDDASNTDL